MALGIGGQSQHRLRLTVGDTTLILSDGGDERPNPGVDYTFATYGRDLTFGSAVPIDVQMGTLLQDGARVMTQGYGNREDAQFFVAIGGPDSAAVAEGEKALALLLGRRAELGWTAPDGFSPESVFDVETSHMVQDSPDEDDDFLEVLTGERVYRVTMQLQPFARAAEPTTVPALEIPAPSTPYSETVLDPADSLTRWSARIGVLTDAGSWLRITSSRSPRPGWTAAAAVDATTRRYVSVEVKAGLTMAAPMGLRFSTGAASSADAYGMLNATDTTSAPGWVRYVYALPPAVTSITAVELLPSLSRTTDLFEFRNLRLSNKPLSGASAGKQSQRTINTGGSARTQGSLAVSNPAGAGLGTVLLYTNPGDRPGFVGLRALRALAGGTADSTAVTGSSEALNSGVSFDIPASVLIAGKYQLLGRMKASAAATITTTAQVRIGGAARGAVETTSATIGASAAWEVSGLGNLTLPVSHLPANSTASVRITITGAASYDEVWLVRLDDGGSVTVVEAGARSRVWIETETVERPYPVVLLGDAANQSDAYADPGADVVRSGAHAFGPGVTQALIVTTDCPNAAAEFTFFRRFMTYVDEGQDTA